MPIERYMYVDGSDTTVHVAYDPAKETIHMQTVHNSAPLVLQNAEERKDPRNGFSDSRQGACARKIASVDSVVYRQWQKEFERIGGKKQGDWVPDWRKFLQAKLAMNPQFMTVEKMVSHNVNEGRIIVK